MPDSLTPAPLSAIEKTPPQASPARESLASSAPLAEKPAIPTPQTSNTAPSPSAQTNPPPPAGINTDIEKILREVKLPERRDFKGAADTKPAAIPVANMESKNLAGMVVKPPADAETANAMASRPDSGNISSVHTLKDDLQTVVKEKKMSLVRAVSLEQDKKRSELIEEDFGRRERRKRTVGILFASALLFLLGGAALAGVYLVMMSHSATNVQQLNSLVFAEQSVALPLDNAAPSELKRRVAGERQASAGSLGSITSIVPIFQGTDPNLQPRQATAAEFFMALGFNAPENLTRSLGAEFFFGLHVVDKNAPVIVVSITNYDRAFAGMLAWERTMNADLSPTFTPVPAITLDVNGIPSERVFKDNVMRNYDVRELKDDSGQTQLYYSFPSPNLLIIAESPYSFPELLSRLQSVRRL